MKDRKVAHSGGGMGFMSGLALLFIGLKLANVIAWSWLWVLAPLWIPVVIFIAVLAIIVAVAAIRN